MPGADQPKSHPTRTFIQDQPNPAHREGGAEAAVRLAGAAPASVRWRSGRGLYAVLFRPLLPDEADCTAVTP
jgi:hypothetical protein